MKEMEVGRPHDKKSWIAVGQENTLKRTTEKKLKKGREAIRKCPQNRIERNSNT